MKANEARAMAEEKKNTHVERQLPITSYLKWVNGRIKKRVEDGEFKVSPVFDGMDAAPNKETCAEIAAELTTDGYTVAFDEKGLITRVSW